MLGLEERREAMVRDQIRSRGVRDARVLDAMGKVPREAYLPAPLRESAYADQPQQVAEGQVMVQPFVLALMLEALQLVGVEKVLEIGAGSGYAAALLAELAESVYTIEPRAQVAVNAAANLAAAGCSNVHLLHDSGTDGWIDEAPFNAILVSSALAEVPESLRQQLADQGRLVIPVGEIGRAQEIMLIRRKNHLQFDQVPIADVRFVPVMGKEVWEFDEPAQAPNRPRLVRREPRPDLVLSERIVRQATAFAEPDQIPLDALLERIGDRRIVLIGEATHGTAEFYAIRAHITRRLIEEKGFNFVAAEADWPDAAHIDHYVRHRGMPPTSWESFARFPTWMWRNRQVQGFVDWLHAWNEQRPAGGRTGFFGLDLYSLHHSARAVVDYLETRDSDLAEIARQRYGCLSPWQADPAAYGKAALSGDYRACEQVVTQMLVDLYARQSQFQENDGDRFLDAEQNARLVSSAERYYRVMYYGSRASWNLRDAHMYDTLCNLLDHHGSGSRAVVWAHNSHAGDASCTEMSSRGEYNLGELVRRHFEGQTCLIGMGTHQGTVAAASEWGGPMELKDVKPSHAQSHEHHFHLTGQPGLLVPLERRHARELHSALAVPRLQRAIGVIYRPESELFSHYLETELSRQFDEYIWIDHSTAITPLSARQLRGMPDTYPSGV